MRIWVESFVLVLRNFGRLPAISQPIRRVSLKFTVSVTILVSAATPALPLISEYRLETCSNSFSRINVTVTILFFFYKKKKVVNSRRGPLFHHNS